MSLLKINTMTRDEINIVLDELISDLDIDYCDDLPMMQIEGRCECLLTLPAGSHYPNCATKIYI